MRVITGDARGRRLRSVPGTAVRPTADRVKEALFSILASRFELAGSALLDLFAGSGALGIEALSRGARRVTFVEKGAASRRVLVENLRLCGFADRAVVDPRSVEAALRAWAAQGVRVDGVLLDPPYLLGQFAATLERLGAGAIVAPGGWVAAEHHVDEPAAPRYGPLQLTLSRRYGKTGLALYTVAEDAVEAHGS